MFKILSCGDPASSFPSFPSFFSRTDPEHGSEHYQFLSRPENDPRTSLQVLQLIAGVDVDSSQHNHQDQRYRRGQAGPVLRNTQRLVQFSSSSHVGVSECQQDGNDVLEAEVGEPDARGKGPRFGASRGTRGGVVGVKVLVYLSFEEEDEAEKENRLVACCEGRGVVLLLTARYGRKPCNRRAQCMACCRHVEVGHLGWIVSGVFGGIVRAFRNPFANKGLRKMQVVICGGGVQLTSLRLHSTLPRCQSQRRMTRYSSIAKPRDLMLPLWQPQCCQSFSMDTGIKSASNHCRGS